MTKKPEQKMLPFEEVIVDAVTPPLQSATQYSTQSAVGYEPSDEALAAYEQLEGWLCTLRGPQTELAAGTLYALARALLDDPPKKGWFHAAEDGLEALKLRNGLTEGEDIPPGPVPEGPNFQRTIDDCLDCLHEVMLSQVRAR